MAQVEQDTTGAGKTLQKLLNWWDKTFPAGSNYRESNVMLLDFFNHESKVHDHVRLVINDVQYPYLKDKLNSFLTRQAALIASLKQRITEQEGKEPVKPEFVFHDQFGVRLTLSLREIHDMYNQYIFQAAVAADEKTRKFMQKLVDEKQAQAELLSDMVTKIHD
ncbi:hypothetical protein F9K33_14295 [bacterium]|nr:MAG: hypothetical protein F9K33_14295 [bacterium]MBL7961063.1 hypothetical protein [bacterium]